MLPLDRIILQAEQKWLEKMMNQCKAQFAGVHLPSHDQTHHLRVWQYTKPLIHIVSARGVPVTLPQVECLLVAVFFHDQGMSVSRSKDHGTISRQICEAYFQHTVASLSFPLADALAAVENHDQKDYTGPAGTKGFNILSLLNIADDLDAFGVTGAYRYLEIYMLRNIPVSKIAGLVIENMSARFKHFSGWTGSRHTFAKSQYMRFLAGQNYFKDLNFQMKQHDYDEKCFIGPMGVANRIKLEIIGNMKNVPSVCDEVISKDPDFYTRHFFERLAYEWNPL